MDNKKRPTRVTVIAWLVIVAGGYMLVVMPLIYTIPEVQQSLEEGGRSVAISVLLAVVAGAIAMVSGIAMLKGLNWGRLLYLGFVPIGFVLSLVLYGPRPRLIIPAIGYIVILAFLTSPDASTFFGSRASAGPKPEK